MTEQGLEPAAALRRVRELEASEARLRQAEAELRYVVTSARCILWHATVRENGRDLKWDLRIWDPEAAQRFLPLAVASGGTYEEAWLGCRPAEDRERCAQIARAALLTGESGYKHEFRCRARDGEERFIWEDVQIEAQRGPGDARRWRLVGVCTDVSERKRLENALLQARKSDAIGQLASGVAHDFNNLLMAITGYAELLKYRLGEENPLHDYADEITSAARHASGLTSQLLAYGRRQFLRPQELDLNAVLAELRPRLERQLGPRVELVLRLEPALGVVATDPRSSSTCS
jgi:signal transduction histidine kinase